MSMRLLVTGISAYTVTPVNKRVAKKLKDITGESSLLFQTDWDYPFLARNLGWDMSSPECSHRGTGGTVVCPDCGMTVGEFIAGATDWLDAHCGYEVQVKDISWCPDIESAVADC